ncbi:hypothetical protein H6P81_002238 [Aristolochia fimbriata]|uniref:GPI mannosyltransferase 2 n=1 Tax=Aristolochia fimbriata TaxID=158543 RepID=A0AAV7F986_ARIFI|nr:hypothetical protein H6P81_002238 [Aristolochia fimbriata]
MTKVRTTSISRTIPSDHRRILRIAVVSRVVTLGLIFLFRSLASPYDTSASINPNCLSENNTGGSQPEVVLLPRIASALESSVVWDGVYFVRIAQCGYEYEQTYAFLPLLPFCIRLLSRSVFVPLVPVVGYRAVLALSGHVISNVAFAFAALYLYRLSLLVLEDSEAAYRASIFFCFNPASIFYSSVYSESLYSLGSFGGIYHLLTGANSIAVLMFALSGSARSNGVLNAGYFCFKALHQAYDAILKNSPYLAFRGIILSALQTLCVFVPFIAFQAYGYFNICLGGPNELQPWCKATVPLLYDYIQSHYWGVGFLRYFQLKQLPNFLLASPMLFFSSCAFVKYLKLRPEVVFSLGFRASQNEKEQASVFYSVGTDWGSIGSQISKERSSITLRDTESIQRRKQKINQEISETSGNSLRVCSNVHSPAAQGYASILILPFVLHLAFMSAVAFLVMHVQVATRFLSSSPPIYWFLSYLMASSGKARRWTYLIWTAVSEMAMKVDQTPAVTVSPSSTVSTSSSKISMFGKKSGFVIPKNKLSGSLVPVFRGSKKLEGGSSSKKDAKQVHRKTKWGLDLTQDTTVKRGRILAYQTRVEQITKQLKSGTEVGDGLDSRSPVHSADDGSYNQQNSNQQQNSEQLELERREAIGEILRLNPNYKAPPDYKPVLKEARVPVPLKAYPGYNFLGVFLSPESSTQKRLEEETGAKIRVVGKKADMLEEREITSADKNDTRDGYQELYVQVSADTFEKVDAAVALIELLVTPVSGNSNTAETSSTSECGDNVRQDDQNVTSGFLVPVASGNPGLMQPMVGFAQSAPLQLQLQPYPSPWAPSGQFQPHMPAVPPPNSGLANPHFAPSAANVYSPPYFGARPLTSVGIQSASVTASPFGPGRQPSVHGLQYPMSQAIPPQSPSMPRTQAPPAYPSLPGPPTSNVHPQFSAPPSIAIPTASDVRPTVNSMPQPMSSASPGPASVANLPAWIGASPTTTHVRPSNVVQAGPNLMPPLRPLTDPHSIMPTNTVSKVSSVVPPTTPPMNRPVGPLLPPAPPQNVGGSLSLVSALQPANVPTIASSTAMSQAPSPTFSQPPRSVNTQPRVLGQAPNVSGSALPLSRPMLVQTPGHILPPSPHPISGNLPSFSPVKPSIANPLTIQPMQSPKPPGPGSSDFTFQPLKPQPLPSQTSLRPSNQPRPPNTHPGQQQPLVRPLPPQTSPFQSAMSNLTTPLNMTGFLRPSANPVGRAPAGPMVPLGPPSRLPAFQNPASLATQMRPTGFMSGPRTNNLVGALPVRPGGSNAIRDMNNIIQNQQPGRNLTFPGSTMASNQSGGNQIYDPFSPT